MPRSVKFCVTSVFLPQACTDWEASPYRPPKTWMLVLVQNIFKPRGFVLLLNASRIVIKVSWGNKSDSNIISKVYWPWCCSVLLPQWLWVVALPITQSMQVLKCAGVRTQPCLTPEFTGKKLDRNTPHFTALLVTIYRLAITQRILVGILLVLKIFSRVLRDVPSRVPSWGRYKLQAFQDEVYNGALQWFEVPR